MAISNTFLGSDDPGQTTFNLTITFLGTFSTVIVKRRELTDTSFTTLVDPDDYTLTKINGIPTQVVLVVGLTATQILLVERFTTRTRLVDYQSGAAIAESNLDGDADRLTSVDEEIESGVTDAMQKNADQSKWEGENIPLSRIQPGTDPTDGVNLQQVQALVEGSDLVVVDDSTVLQFDGDGATTKFELGPQGANAGIANIAKRGLLLVVINNVMQSRADDTPVFNLLNPGDGGYTGGGTFTQIEFNAAPATGTKNIEISTFNGTIRATTGPLSITTEQIQDGAVTPAKMSPGTDKQVLINRGTTPQYDILTHEDISDFDTGVRQNRLDQMAAPTADVVLNNQKMTGLASDVAAASAATVGQVNQSLTDANQFTLDQIGVLNTTLTEEVAFSQSLGPLTSRIETINFANAPDYIEILGIGNRLLNLGAGTDDRAISGKVRTPTTVFADMYVATGWGDLPGGGITDTVFIYYIRITRVTALQYTMEIRHSERGLGDGVHSDKIGWGQTSFNELENAFALGIRK